MERIYPVGNTSLRYYEDVMDYFESQGFQPEGSEILTVGADLVGWYLQNCYPESSVSTLELDGRTSSLQYEIGERLMNGDDPSCVESDVRNALSEFDVNLEAGEEIGNIYPEVVREIGGRASRPESRSVGHFADYHGEADLVITNNVYDYMAREDFFEAVDMTGADFVEMYSVMPDVRDSIQQEGNLDIDPEFDPEVSFQWEGLDGVTIALLS